MPQDTPASTLARSPRIEMKDGRSGQVEVRRLTDAGMETLRGSLLDLSRGGAKIVLDRGLLFDESISLSVTIPDIDLQFTVDCTVVWSRAGDDERWVAGCSFQNGLPTEVVDRLAAAGYLDRQASPRYAVALRGTVCWELSAGSVAAVVQDLSSEGFCMLCAKSGEPGQRLKLRLTSADGKQRLVAARSRWQIRSEDGFLVGCAFLNPYDFHALWQMAQGVQPSPSVVSRLTLPTPPWVPVWFSALVVFLMAYPALVRYFTLPAAGVAQPLPVAIPSSPAPAIALSASPAAAAEPAVSGSPAPEADTRYSPQQLAALDERYRQLEIAQAALEKSRAEHRASMARYEKSIEIRRAELQQRENDLTRLAETSAQALRQQQAELDAARSRLLTEQSARNSERENLIAENADLQIRWQTLQQELRDAKSRTRDLLDEHRRLAVTTLPAAQAPPRDVPLTDPSSLPPPEEQPAAAATGAQRLPGAMQPATLRGQSLLEGGQFAEAADQFRRSIADDPTDAFSHYLLALAQRRMGNSTLAEQTVAEAARIERGSPLVGWGRAMQRHQGSARLWLERARREALQRTAHP